MRRTPFQRTELLDTVTALTDQICDPVFDPAIAEVLAAVAVHVPPAAWPALQDNLRQVFGVWAATTAATAAELMLITCSRQHNEAGNVAQMQAVNARQHVAPRTRCQAGEPEPDDAA